MKNNNKYWFILGRERKLSAAEIAAVLDLPLLDYKEEAILKIKTEKINSDTINKLGGTIKIGIELDNDLTLEELKNKIITELKDNTGKIVFGLSFLYAANKKIGIEIKKELKKLGCSVRYVEPKNLSTDKQERTLNAAQIIGNKIIEKGGDFLIEEHAGKFNVAKTIGVQNVNEWSKRDFDRPGSDSYSGMLPPKLAMTMINLSGAKKTNVLLDPFCGSGTVLTEAIYLGYKNLIGSDLSDKAITDTEKNVEWIKTQCETKQLTTCHSELVSKSPKTNIFHSDATKLTETLKPNSVDYIVTEPLLGKPLTGSEPKSFLLKQEQELKKIYEKAFENFKEILKPNGTIVFVVPKFKLKDKWIIINILPKLKELGFKIEPMLQNQNHIIYCRPDQRLAREIWKFKLNK